MSTRLHVLLAQKAPVAVVIRRGPSKRVCTILWDLKTNTFELGQWLKGRIYERRSDISPDGRYLLYFAMNGRQHSETHGSWTAISEVPYLKARVLYGKGDCWNGGGLFLDARRYWLNDRYGSHWLIRNDTGLTRAADVTIEVPFGNNECLGVYYPRLLSSGWSLNEDLTTKSVQVFDKKWRPGARTLILRKFCHIGGDQDQPVYWDSHLLINAKGSSLDCPDWEWADIVGETLAWAQDGKLYLLPKAGPFGEASPLADAVMLYDFNPMMFKEIAADY